MLCCKHALAPCSCAGRAHAWLTPFYAPQAKSASGAVSLKLQLRDFSGAGGQPTDCLVLVNKPALVEQLQRDVPRWVGGRVGVHIHGSMQLIKGSALRFSGFGMPLALLTQSLHCNCRPPLQALPLHASGNPPPSTACSDAARWEAPGAQPLVARLTHLERKFAGGKPVLCTTSRTRWVDQQMRLHSILLTSELVGQLGLLQ